MSTARLALLLCASVMTFGCAQSGANQEAADLNATAVAWNAYHDANRTGPGNWDELIAFAEAQPSLNQEALQRVKQAGWDLKWSLSIRDLMEPEHQPLTNGPAVNVMIGTSPSGKRLYRDGLVQ